MGHARQRQRALVALCLVEGGHVAPAQRNEVWGGGSDGIDRQEHERQVNLPGFVTGPVFLAEPTWRWK